MPPLMPSQDYFDTPSMPAAEWMHDAAEDDGCRCHAALPVVEDSWRLRFAAAAPPLYGAA